MRLSTKFIVGLTALVALMWLVALYAAQAAAGNLRREIVRETAIEVRTLIERIDRLFAERIHFWMTYGKLKSVQQLLSASNHAFGNRPDAEAWIDRQDELWQRADRSVDAGTLIQTLIENDESVDLLEVLDAFETENGYRVYGEVFITNRFGAVAALSNRTSDYRQNDEDWWRRAMQQGAYVGDFQFDRSAGVFSTALCVRIDDADGQPIGVLKAVFDIKDVIELVRSHVDLRTANNDTSVMLVTAGGRLVASTDASDDVSQASRSVADDAADAVPEAPGVRSWRDPATGDDVLIAQVGSSASPGLHGPDWTLFVRRKEAVDFGPAIRVRNQILFVAALGTIAALVFAAWLTVPLSRRVSQLADSAAQIGAGRFDRTIPVTGRDELGQLGQALDQMRIRLAEQTAELRMTQFSIDHCPDGVLWTTRDGRFFYVNEAACAGLGYGREQLLGRCVTDIDCRMSLKTWKGVWRDARANGDKTIQTRHRTKDGHEFPVELSVRVLEFDGREYGFATVRDLTERRRIEQSERQRQHLQDALQSMEQVIAVIGHELRTPLAALRATSEFLITDGAKSMDDSVVLIHNIHDETIRMADLVNNMLEAARLNSGSARWNWTTVALSDALDQALNIVRPLIDHGRVALEPQVPPGLKLSGDCDAIQRLLINLIGNSAKHTSAGSIRIEASQRFDDNGRWIQIDISDTGEGIPDSVIQKLGRAFVLNSGVVGSDYVKGSGLGLAICRGIAAAHGGWITVRSKVGKGATFTVQLRADLTGACEINQQFEIQEALK